MITRDGIQGLAAFAPATPAKTDMPKADAKAGFDKELSQALGKPTATPATLRPDYKNKLEEALKSLIGPQTPTTPAKVDPAVAPLLKAAEETPAPAAASSKKIDLDKLPGATASPATKTATSALKTIDLDKLPEKTLNELKSLQTAAEGFEAHFIKDWFSKMRQTSFDSDKSQTGAMAKDFMDQALSESAAKGNANLGIGKTVFAETGKRVVQEALARLRFHTDTTA